MAMLNRSLAAFFVISVVASACGSPISDYCSKERECYLKDCDYTDDACDAYARGGEEECLARFESEKRATASAGSAVCDRCIEANEALLACAADATSCAAFDDANRNDGPCDSERDAWGDACDSVEDDCWQ